MYKHIIRCYVFLVNTCSFANLKKHLKTAYPRVYWFSKNAKMCNVQQFY